MTMQEEEIVRAFAEAERRIEFLHDYCVLLLEKVNRLDGGLVEAEQRIEELERRAEREDSYRQEQAERWT